MGTTLAGTRTDRAKLGLAVPLLAAPMIGLVALLWSASHRIAKPDISIFQAIESNDYEAVRAHVLTGTPVNAVNPYGHTPLFVAISDRRQDMVRFLIDHGASVNAETSGSLSPLYEAAGQGNLDLVKELLDKGAKADETYLHGQTALMAAANSGNFDVVKLLLDRGAKADTETDNGGGSPLCNAVLSGNIRVVKLLLDHGANIKATANKGETPLHFAATRGDVPIAELLLSRGASADTRDDVGIIPLATSLLKGTDGMTRLLMSHTTRFNVVDTIKGSDLLHYAVLGHAATDIVKTLLAKGCDPNLINRDGETPLSIAYDQGDKPMAAALEQSGGRLPLRYLIRQALKPPQTGPRGKFADTE